MILIPTHCPRSTISSRWFAFILFPCPPPSSATHCCSFTSSATSNIGRSRSGRLMKWPSPTRRTDTVHDELEARFKKYVHRRQLKITKNLFIVSCTFVLCTAPYTLAVLVTSNPRPLLFLSVLFTFNSCINPILYTVNHPRFNVVIRCILGRRLGDIPKTIQTTCGCPCSIHAEISILTALFFKIYLIVTGTISEMPVTVTTIIDIVESFSNLIPGYFLIPVMPTPYCTY